MHHIIQQAGAFALIALKELPNPTHPYMLRRTGLSYRAALLLQKSGLSLRQSCLIWNWLATTTKFSSQESLEYLEISQLKDEAFWAALKQQLVELYDALSRSLRRCLRSEANTQSVVRC